jgi:hypothetical protein
LACNTSPETRTHRVVFAPSRASRYTRRSISLVLTRRNPEPPKRLLPPRARPRRDEKAQAGAVSAALAAATPPQAHTTTSEAAPDRRVGSLTAQPYPIRPLHPPRRRPPPGPPYPRVPALGWKQTSLPGDASTGHPRASSPQSPIRVGDIWPVSSRQSVFQSRFSAEARDPPAPPTHPPPAPPRGHLLPQPQRASAHAPYTALPPTAHSRARTHYPSLLFRGVSPLFCGLFGVWPNLSPSRDFARRNTAHAWTDGPPLATFMVP